MRTNYRIFSTLTLAAAAVGFTACASSPEVPTDSSKKTPNYKSTQSQDEQSDEPKDEKGATSASGSSAPAKGANKSAQRSGNLPEATGPVAHVDGEPVPAEAFNNEIQKVAKTGKFPTSVLNKLKGRLIERLIDQHLIDNAIAEASIEVSEKEIDQKMEEVRAQFDKAAKKRGNKNATLETVAEEYGISNDELRESFRRIIAMEKLVRKEGMKPPTDEKVKAFYEKNKNKFMRPEAVHVRHIVAKVSPGSDEKKWKKAKKRIEKIRKTAVSDGTKFADLAKKESEGQAAKNGGDIGYITRNNFDKQFTKVAFELEKGDISKPVRSNYGWHIVKLIDRREKAPVPFDEIKGRLEERLKKQKIQQHLNKQVKKLRQKAKIEKHPENIE